MMSPHTALRAATTADSLYAKGRYQDAATFYLVATRLNPTAAEYHYKLAMAAWRIRQVAQVEKHFQKAVELEPDDPKYQAALARFYFETGRPGQAVEFINNAIRLDPDNIEFLIVRAYLHEVFGQFEAILQLSRPLIARGVQNSDIAVLLGRIARAMHCEQEAIEYISSVLQLPHPDESEKARLHFALANVLDRLGQYDEAFVAARRANEYHREPYHPRSATEFVDRRIAYFQPDRMSRLCRASRSSRRPVFIVGMPRSGTTLVEQILASHPQVYGAGELSALVDATRTHLTGAWAQGKRYPECLDHLTVDVSNQMAADYLAAIDGLDTSAAYVIDKMHQNFQHIGLIALIFPQCHIIHCMRDPLDNCLACYMRYLLGSAYAQDLTHLGLYYRDYRRLMEHWKRVVRVPIIDVQYEDVVGDVAGQARRLLKWLGLPWDERCLRFYENQRAVATLSGDQVRKPIYKSSIQRWKHYEKYLGELKSALGITG